MPSILTIDQDTVTSILSAQKQDLLDVVAATYLQHSSGQTVNPDSYFLRFPKQPNDRIIALPSAIYDEKPIAGIKWISSFPGNIDEGVQRASAVIILNELEHGFPIAFIEGSYISAVRTAFSAALAAKHLIADRDRPISVGIIGAGYLAKNIVEALSSTGRIIHGCFVYDKDTNRAATFAKSLRMASFDDVQVCDGPDIVFNQDLVVLATTAANPYLHDVNLIKPGQIILNISLRDLSPELILNNWNMVDDVEHCLKAGTSPHLAEKMSGNRDFVAGTIADLMNGRIKPDRKKGLIFSPFGLGVLDLALGRLVYERAKAEHVGVMAQDFFSKHNQLGGQK